MLTDTFLKMFFESDALKFHAFWVAMVRSCWRPMQRFNLSLNIQLHAINIRWFSGSSGKEVFDFSCNWKCFKIKSLNFQILVSLVLLKLRWMHRLGVLMDPQSIPVLTFYFPSKCNKCYSTQRVCLIFFFWWWLRALHRWKRRVKVLEKNWIYSAVFLRDTS